MKLTYSIKTALSGLRTHKSRSALTVLGIVIGITSIMVVMSLGAGAQNLIVDQIQGSMSSKVIEVRPGRDPKGPTDFLSIMFSDSLKIKEVEALKKKINLPNAVGVMPLAVGSESAVFGSETYRTTFYGVSELASHMYNIIPIKGRFLSEDDIKSYADVAVIGNKVRQQLFVNNEEALGQKIKIKGRNFKVIGVLQEKGQGVVSFDEAIFIPYTTAQQYILGKKYFQHIVVEADTEINVNKTVEDIKVTLRNLHNITDPEKDDFSVGSQADALKTVGSVIDALTLFLAAVAAISLIVGGIGIMNIMLVSVTERTKEIGLRKAIGATDNNILTQFLLEAVILTGLGGVIGIILGSAISFVASFLINRYGGLNWTYSFPFMAAILGIGVSSLVGLVFGLYPARQAAKKSPMEALRYE